MRTQCSPRAKVEGSVFIVALGIAILMTLILSSYLTLVQGQANAVARSQNYNAAIPVAEAGVEEALALLNKFYPNVAASGAAWTNTLTADGWTSLSSSNTTSKSNLVFGSNYYFVTISNGPGAGPVIFSAGVVPFIQNNWGGQMLSNTTLASSVVALVRKDKIDLISPISQALALGTRPGDPGASLIPLVILALLFSFIASSGSDVRLHHEIADGGRLGQTASGLV